MFIGTFTTQKAAELCLIPAQNLAIKAVSLILVFSFLQVLLSIISRMATQTILHVLAGFHERILKLLDVMENCLLLCDEIQELENAMRPMQCIKQFNNSLSHVPTQARRFRDEGAEGEDVDGSLYCLYTFLISRWLVRSRVFHKTQSISDQVPLSVCAVTIISKISPKKLDHFYEN